MVYFTSKLDSATNTTLTTFPSSVNGQLPADGGTTFANGQSLVTNTPGYAGSKFRLTITKSNGSLSKVVTADASANATFTDVTNGGNNVPAIPTAGVLTVELDYFATPF